MELYVKDIEKIWSNGEASLVAGKNGIMRKVDVYDMMEQPDIKPWMKEHLLVITTGYSIRNDKEAVLKVIRDMNEGNASALAIKTRFFDEFPGEALELADELNLPLFFINNNVGFTELVFPIMVAIVEARNNVELSTRFQLTRHNKADLDDRLYSEIINGRITQKEEADHRSASLQWPHIPVRVIGISLESEENQALLEIKKERQIRECRRIFETYHSDAVVICRKEKCFCITRDIFSESVIQKIAEELTDKTREINKCPSVSIISEPLDEYLKLADCYREIREGFRIRRLRKQKWTSVFQKDMQYDQILLHTAQTQKSREYILRKLGPLEQYDRIHDSQLLTTLDTLIHYNGSRRQASEALFLHRNTMAHRIRKIEEILGVSLDDPEEIRKLSLACQLKMYV